jgi:hypothetical protein
MMRRLALTLAGAIIAIGAPPSDKAGIHPRPNANEYPAHEQQSGTSYAAAAPSKEELHNSFVTNLADGYIVLEVAVYPKSGDKLDLNRDDFLLRVGGSGDAIRPADPETVAGVLQRKNTPRPPSNSDVTVYPSVGVGYGSGTTPDGRHVHGWETQTGVGVGVGPTGPPNPAPGSTDRDRSVMTAELNDKALPEGAVSAPVAGYLYFPMPSKKKASGVYELRYDNGAANVRLYVPRPKS